MVHVSVSECLQCGCVKVRKRYKCLPVCTLCFFAFSVRVAVVVPCWAEPGGRQCSWITPYRVLYCREVQWLKRLGWVVLNHPLVKSYPYRLREGSRARWRGVLLYKSDLPIHTVHLPLSQGSLALEAIKFTHANQFNYASVMSPEIS